LAEVAQLHWISLLISPAVDRILDVVGPAIGAYTCSI
jgi:hypothetical protein